MKILFVLRSDHERHVGGDVVQTRKVARYLEKAGHRTVFADSPYYDLEGIDAVHLFNLNLPLDLFNHARRARAAGKPILLAPIYWDMTGLWPAPPSVPWKAAIKRRLPGGAVEAVQRWKRFARDIRPTSLPLLTRSYAAMQRAALEAANVVVVNSRAEEVHLRTKFQGTRLRDVRVVFNGCDPVSAFDRETFLEKHAQFREKKYVVCVGHIGPRKNQLALAEAAMGLDLDVLIVGEENQNEEGYAARLNAMKPDNVHLLGRLDHETTLACMAGAAAHVLPSWIETPGLASLEAAMTGCPIVCGECAPVREYFGECALYCQPDDVASIRRALVACRDGRAPRPDPAEIRKKFAWGEVLRAYDPIIAAIGGVAGTREAPSVAGERSDG